MVYLDSSRETAPPPLVDVMRFGAEVFIILNSFCDAYAYGLQVRGDSSMFLEK